MSPLLSSLLFLGLLSGAPASPDAPQPLLDSAYVFAYSTEADNSRGGLHIAWSADCVTWHEIGPQYSFVRSDYGDWGSQKRMLDPYLIRREDGGWTALWRVNESEDVLAVTLSDDLVHWKPQDYYPSSAVSEARNLPERLGVALPLSGEVKGTLHKVGWRTVGTLLDAVSAASAESRASAERAIDDPQRFAGLAPQKLTARISESGSKRISDKLIGIFFEDINYAADGGLYAELVQNRDFEYSSGDRSDWTPESFWTLKGEGLEWSVQTDDPLHSNNPHYARLEVSAAGGALCNRGYDGIALKAGEKYDFSVFARTSGALSGRFEVRLVDPRGSVLAKGRFSVKSPSWKRISLVLKASSLCDDASLEIVPLSAGSYALDMISLFPQNTFKGRKNGLRADLAQTLADLKPKFVRFPGGCVAHGNGTDNIYRWKNTIGPLESRVPDRNLWGYHQSLGLGFYEYFQMCEDFGSEPLPVIAAGVPCQNSWTGGYGQQGGVPMEEMDAFIQDIVDLVEWANGDPKTSLWARRRAEAGHPEPFGLKYIGIGNEDLISNVFKERFRMIYEALRERCPEITVIGTAGPFWSGSDYDEGWRFAAELGVPVVDEHYYVSPGWFVHHGDFYDRYSRTGARVYLGEYAAHIPSRTNCLETALAEAMHLCNVERNGDVVEMTSYAPLLARRGHTQWNPDLIYFTGTGVELTTGYQVQKLFGCNGGDRYLPSSLSLERPDAGVMRRIALSSVTDSASGDLIVKVVNMLPVSTSLSLALPESFAAGEHAVECSTLSGELSATDLVPANSTLTASSGCLEAELPAYSFSVYRIRR